MNEHDLKQQIDKINNTVWKDFGQDVSEAKEKSRCSAELAEQINYTEGMVFALLCEAWCCFHLTQFDLTLKLFKEAADLCSDKESKNYLRSLNGIASVYLESGLYTEALEMFSKNEKAARKLKIDEQISAALNNIGEVNIHLHQYEIAFDYFLNALEYAERDNLKLHIATILINLGKVYLHRGETETALIHFDKVIELDVSICTPEAYLNIGKTLQKSDKIEDALKNLNLAVELAVNYKQTLIFVDAAIVLADLYSITGEEDKARTLLEYVLSENRKSEKFEESNKIYLALYKNSKSRKDYQKALEFHEKLRESEKKEFTEVTSKQISVLSTKNKLNETQEENRIIKETTNQLQAAFNRIAVISDIGQEITSSLNLQTIIEIMYERVNSMIDADIFGIATFNESTQDIDYKLFIKDSKQLDLKTRNINMDSSLAAYCLRNNTNIYINGKDEIDKYPDTINLLMGDKIESIIYIRLTIKDSVVGVLTVQSKKKNTYNQHDIEALTILGSYLAIALDNSEIHSQVYKLNELLQNEKKQLEEINSKIEFMVNHDPLTGLPNRKLFHELFTHLYSMCGREKSTAAIFYMDLDRFKPINDNYGHKTGDIVLKTIASRFTENLRKEDIVSRIGGDEFIAVIKGNKKRWTAVAEKIITAVNEPIILNEGEVSVGVSIGITVFPQGELSEEQLISNADEAMYDAKRQSNKSFCFSRKNQTEKAGRNKSKGKNTAESNR